MKSNKTFWVVIFFMVISTAPFVPVFMSFMKLRNSVIVDQAVKWEENSEQRVQLPELSKSTYEIRLESGESTWQPSLKANWKIEGLAPEQAAVLPSSGDSLSPEPINQVQIKEWVLTQPLAKFRTNTQVGPSQIVLSFLNSNPKQADIRLKVARDRDVLLQDASREFGIVLAISLALTLLLWKPLMVNTKPTS